MPKITELYAYVMIDKDKDDEDVPSFESGLHALPMMGADINRARCIRFLAQKAANEHGKPLKLIKSTGIEVIDVIYPNQGSVEHACEDSTRTS